MSAIEDGTADVLNYLVTDAENPSPDELNALKQNVNGVLNTITATITMKASEAGDLLTRTGDSITIIANEAVDGSATSFDGSSGITALNLLTTRTGAGITATLNATKDELTNDDGDATTLTTDSDDIITINISTESGNVFDFGLK